MSSDTQVQAMLPKYKCHKEVWALKIKSVEASDEGSAVITPEDRRYARFRTHSGWVERFKGGGTDLGYYVVYQDGYESWSPTKAFEEGYTQI